MLTVARKMHQLHFGQLMEVYQEGNRENGEDFFPQLTPAEQMIRAEQEFYTYLTECFFGQNGAAYFIWSEKGHYVSALRLEHYQDGLLLEALETHPDHRGRGYAKKLIRAALEQVDCQKVYVHISRRNAASIAVHSACGFRKILDYSVCADGSLMRNMDTWLYEKATLD